MSSSHNNNDGQNTEPASQPDAEDGGAVLLPDGNTSEGESEDYLNIPPTAHPLNADGRPKRPMNAFMIFARRRRPVVESENPGAGLGDISKILAREWVSMPAAAKAVYLQQAYQLKQAFDAQYPDYVYRRPLRED